jgi:Mn-dependent DtxR family transcriptional regulator
LLRRILAEDILALLYRHVEAQGSENLSAADQALSIERISSKLQAPSQAILSALSDLAAKRWVSGQGKSWNLTQSGYQQAQVLIRTHRLWEHYLREETGISDPRLHASAESLEHYTSSQLRESLGQFTGGPTVDPHGKQIPPETP